MTVVRHTQGTRTSLSAVFALVLAAGSVVSVAQAQNAQPNSNPTNTQNTSGQGGAQQNQDRSPRLQQMLEQAATNGGDPANQAAGNPNFGGQGVSVSEYMTVDLFVQDEDLANVLQMLSLQSQRNIVASRDVSARVTANLYGVTFHEALDAILHVNGYGYVERGNFIYVHTIAELEQIQQEQRQQVSRVVQLNYLNANDAAEFVVPLLSDAGTIKTNGDVGEFTIPEDTPTGSEEFALSATLVIYDYAEHVDEIVALLEQLDTRPAQVLVEATILQTQINEANAFGIDFAFINDFAVDDFLGIGGLISSADAIINDDIPAGDGLTDGRGTAITVTPGRTSGPGTLKVGIIHDDIGVFVRLLDEVSDVTILSNPKVLALNRQPARVLVGRKLGFLNTTATQTSTTQTVEFLDTGTQLSFRPFISKDGNIRLELKPRVSEGIIREASDATGAAVTIPDEITQEVTTNVIVPDGSTVVLGGLFRETTQTGRRQVPFFGDIPVIGAAFRGYDDDTERQEIIFLIKPTIMSDQVLLEEGDRALAEAERVRTGTRRGLLPFSRERQTAQLNMKARDYAAEGNVDKALWCLRRSLELHPNQADAIRMRELLGGKVERWPHESVLEEIISGEAAARAARAIQTPDANRSSEARMPQEFTSGLTGAMFFDAMRNDGSTDEFMEGSPEFVDVDGQVDYDPIFENRRSTTDEFNVQSNGNRNFNDNSGFNNNNGGASNDNAPQRFVPGARNGNEQGDSGSNFDRPETSNDSGASDLDAGNWNDNPNRRDPQTSAQSRFDTGNRKSDWKSIMGGTWAFAKPVPVLPFGMFWTVGDEINAATNLVQATPAQFITEVLTSVDPSANGHD